MGVAVLGVDQSELELIRRAAPKGKNKGGSGAAHPRLWGVKEALKGVA
jgi:hypothetical protein